ncbi:hypothetical protein A9G23_05660 [Gilliamella sp. App4-10]|nr:hypothetical protein A9G23_05660 [Gilliamella apicola]
MNKTIIKGNFLAKSVRYHVDFILFFYFDFFDLTIVFLLKPIGFCEKLILSMQIAYFPFQKQEKFVIFVS